jgi:transposase
MSLYRNNLALDIYYGLSDQFNQPLVNITHKHLSAPPNYPYKMVVNQANSRVFMPKVLCHFLHLNVYDYANVDKGGKKAMLIRAVQFARNKSLRYWIDNKGATKFDLNKYCAVLAKELNSQVRQSAAESAWLAIARFFDNCKKKVAGKKGYPKFQKNNRSVEYKTTGWSLSEDRKYITFTDKKNIGLVKLLGTRDLNFYQPEQIKRLRLVKCADGYYCQFVVSVDREEILDPSGQAIGAILS